MIFTGLEVSTLNISPETAQLLDRYCAYDQSPLILYPKKGYGWFIPIVEEDGTDLPYGWEKIPEDLQKVVQYAMSVGCTWIMFDRDCEEVPTLPKYEWK